MKYLFFLVALIFVMDFSNALVINEIMYNPTMEQGGDANVEWVELYNNGDEIVNLADWTLDGKIFDDYNISSGEYLIVVDKVDGTDSFEEWWGNNDSVWNSTDGNYSVIDGLLSLGDDEDTFNITNSSYSDVVHYLDDWGADSDGYTLEKINPNGTNERSNWAVSLVVNGTPGYQNSVYGTSEVDYNQIEISEFLPDPEGYDNAPMPNGEWIELYNPTNTAMELKWMFFKDLSRHILYITDTTVSSATIIPPKGYLVVYTNGKSSFLNNKDAEALSFYDKLGNLIKNISYIDPVEGHSYAYVKGMGWQHTKPTPGEENINYSGVKNSNFEIIDVYDRGSNKKAKFGQTIRVKVNVYKGNDTKNVVRLYVADESTKISKESKISIYTRFTNYTLTVPIQLKPNCDEKYDDGDYTIFIRWTSEGSAQDSFPLEVRGITSSLCKTIKVEKKKASPGKFSYGVMDVPQEINVGEKFDLTVKLDNNDNQDIPIKLWSYVYRGSKSYSGDREENMKEFTLKANSLQIIELGNLVEDAEPGDYKFKVIVNKNNQKTNNEIVKEITIINDNSNENINDNTKNNPVSFTEENKITNSVVNFGEVYESSTEKAKNLVPLFLILLSVLLNVVLILKR